MGCNCSSPDEWKKELVKLWNQDLLTEVLRICNICGNTLIVRRLKDEPGRYACDGCYPKSQLEVS